MSLSPEFRKLIKGNAYYVDRDMIPYYKVFCMYGLTFLTDDNKFEKPDERIREFGDTALIIYNPNEFLERFLRALHNKYEEKVNVRIDEVKYIPPTYKGNADEFIKSDSYSGQNELRMRVALLGPEFKYDENGNKLFELIKDKESITLDIGDISDISIQISVDDLIDLKLPDQILPD